MKAPVVGVIAQLLVLAGCGGGAEEQATSAAMAEWAEALQPVLAEAGGRSISEFDMASDVRAELTKVDGWGKQLEFLPVSDGYHLVSAGPDGEFGNADDVVMVNGELRDATETYATADYHW